MIPAPGAALSFDIDGTLADTDPLHLEAFNRTFEPYGHHFGKERFARELQGMANEAIARAFVPHLSLQEQAEVMLGKEAIFRDLAATEIHAVPGLFALLDLADAAGLPMAAVTNAPRLNANLILDGLGIAHRFKALVIGEELAHGKPHPLPISKFSACLARTRTCPWPSRIPALALHRRPGQGWPPLASGRAFSMTT